MAHASLELKAPSSVTTADQISTLNFQSFHPNFLSLSLKTQLFGIRGIIPSLPTWQMTKASLKSTEMPLRNVAKLRDLLFSLRTWI